MIERLLEPGGSNLTAKLLAMDRNEERVKEAFIAVLGREPDSSEKEQSVAYLAVRKERLEAGVKQLVWALLAGAEFQTNH